VLDPSHATKQVAALGSSHDTLRLIRRPQSAMKAPQYQIVRVNGLIETEEQYQVSVFFPNWLVSFYWLELCAVAI
jgi:zinc finger-containing ubiquitin peptidase 1